MKISDLPIESDETFDSAHALMSVLEKLGVKFATQCKDEIFYTFDDYHECDECYLRMHECEGHFDYYDDYDFDEDDMLDRNEPE